MEKEIVRVGDDMVFSLEYELNDIFRCLRAKDNGKYFELLLQSSDTGYYVVAKCSYNSEYEEEDEGKCLIFVWDVEAYEEECDLPAGVIYWPEAITYSDRYSEDEEYDTKHIMQRSEIKESIIRWHYGRYPADTSLSFADMVVRDEEIPEIFHL